MEEYTSHFFKVVIKVFQHSRQFLQLDIIKKLVDQLITSEKLLVVANSLPLYIVTSMFFNSDQINQAEGIVKNIFDMILKKIDEVKTTAATL